MPSTVAHSQPARAHHRRPRARPDVRELGRAPAATNATTSPLPSGWAITPALTRDACTEPSARVVATMHKKLSPEAMRRKSARSVILQLYRARVRRVWWNLPTCQLNGEISVLLATTDSGLYKTLLVLHILTAIVGLGSVMLNGLYAAQAQKRQGPPGRAVSEANFAVSSVGEYFIYAIPCSASCWCSRATRRTSSRRPGSGWRCSSTCWRSGSRTPS